MSRPPNGESWQELAERYKEERAEVVEQLRHVTDRKERFEAAYEELRAENKLLRGALWEVKKRDAWQRRMNMAASALVRGAERIVDLEDGRLNDSLEGEGT